jgi:hypothetical protein
MFRPLLPMALLSASVVTPVLWMEDGPLVAARSAWRRAASAYRGDDRLRRWKQNTRWALAAAAKPMRALAWFEAMDAPGMRPFAQARPRLAFKPLRAYLSAKWNLNRRTKVLMDTYEFAQVRGGVVREALLRREPIRLAGFSLKDAGDIEIRIGTDERFRKEGELTLFLHCEHLGGPVAALAFSLERESGREWVLYAGCVQGLDDGRPEVVRQLTKAMHGWRPKAVMVFLAQVLAESLQVRRIRGAGNAIQVHRRKHAIHIPLIHKLSFDYDGLWTEAGGTLRPDGWFELPAAPRRKSPEEMKPNKRGMYAKRHALMDTLSEQIRVAISGCSA